MPAVEVLESAPPPGRRMGRAAVAAAVAAVAGAGVLAAVVLTRADEPVRGPFVAMDPFGGRQMSAFGDGRHGYIGPLEVLVPDVAVVSVVPVDADGRAVPHERSAVEPDLTRAQLFLHGELPARPEPLTAKTGDQLSVVLVVGRDCTGPSAITAVRLVLTVQGRAAEQVVALPPEHQEELAARLRGGCPGG